jgi:hypothetical protein
VARKLTVADVIYDPATHTSKLVDGREVPHVTAVLSATGVSTDFEELGRDRPWMRERIVAAGDRGTAVHADCHAYDDNDLDMVDVHPDVRPFVDVWGELRDNLKMTPLTRERRVFHPTHVYTGFIDGIFHIGAGKYKGMHALGDIKTGTTDAAEYQTAAYEGALRATPEYDGPLPDLRLVFKLLPGTRKKYDVINYSEHREAAMDYTYFLAFLTTYRRQASRRPRRA